MFNVNLAHSHTGGRNYFVDKQKQSFFWWHVDSFSDYPHELGNSDIIRNEVFSLVNIVYQRSIDFFNDNWNSVWIFWFDFVGFSRSVFERVVLFEGDFSGHFWELWLAVGGVRMSSEFPYVMKRERMTNCIFQPACLVNSRGCKFVRPWLVFWEALAGKVLLYAYESSVFLDGACIFFLLNKLENL